MPKLESSAVDRVEHDAGSGTLHIWYRGGDRYSYFDVPRDTYDALLGAVSAGAFVNAEIKPYYQFALEPGKRKFRPPAD